MRLLTVVALLSCWAPEEGGRPAQTGQPAGTGAVRGARFCGDPADRMCLFRRGDPQAAFKTFLSAGTW
jgi:hypothetical protein